MDRKAVNNEAIRRDDVKKSEQDILFVRRKIPNSQVHVARSPVLFCFGDFRADVVSRLIISAIISDEIRTHRPT